MPPAGQLWNFKLKVVVIVAHKFVDLSLKSLRFVTHFWGFPVKLRNEILFMFAIVIILSLSNVKTLKIYKLDEMEIERSYESTYILSFMKMPLEAPLP